MWEQTNEWELHHLDGSSGEAYMGVSKDEKIFLKRNASPIITTLSTMGITPKLKWSQRTYSGDTLTAQEWAPGRTLTRQDMAQTKTIDLIRRVHQADHLPIILKRVGGQVKEPQDFIADYYQDLAKNLQNHSYFNQVVQSLKDRLAEGLYRVPYCVCHGDLNHHNFIYQEEEDHLYLVDWEQVYISDPISDITRLLVLYLPPSQWMDWFNQYGMGTEDGFYHRVKWFSLINCLLVIKQYNQENQPKKVNQMVLLMKSIFES